MNRTYFTRMAIPLMGIAFGFFFGCSSTQNLNQSSTDNSLSEKQLEQRLQQIEQRISEDADNSEAYYQKGDVLYSLAQKQQPPEERTSYYDGMQDALDQANELYLANSNKTGQENVDELLQVSWSYEHNRGVELMQPDSSVGSDTYLRAAAHFNNAITIIPDSAVSYKMKARAQYRANQPEDAITTLEAARNTIENLPAAQLEQLAYLYLEADQTQQAVDLYEEAESFSDNNLNLLHGLANAYIMADNHEKAVDLLATLVDNEPENIIYLESYGTELYQLGIARFEALETMSGSDPQKLQQQRAEADTLLNLAQNQFKKILQQNPERAETKEQLARVYKNHAVRLNQVKQKFEEDARKAINNEIEAHLSSAITLYEELTQEYPEHTDYWSNLYQAYSYLGMDEKANEAKTKANI